MKRWRSHKSINEIFNRFSGKSIDPSNPEDPVRREMEVAAGSRYSQLRLFKGATPPESLSNPRLGPVIAVEVTEGPDETLKVGNRFLFNF